jgi:TusE/DsrC/DsvC family sulfur relay protein
MIIELNGRAYDVDENGFLKDHELWNATVAADFATTECVNALGDDHWRVLNYIRDYYTQYSIAPTIRKLCATTSLRLRQIYELFPSGPAMGACKVAGLPRPDGCV